jgi:hypothetical protein
VQGRAGMIIFRKGRRRRREGKEVGGRKSIRRRRRKQGKRWGNRRRNRGRWRRRK